MLQGMNKDAQKQFMTVLEGKAPDEEYKDVAANLVTSVGETMEAFIIIFPSLRGPAKLNKIEEMRLLLTFVQRMCDGQYTDAQSFFGEKKMGNSQDNGKSLIELTIQVMEALRQDLSELMKWSIDTTQFIYILKLAGQTFSALSDFMQGPHEGNQKLLLESNIMSVCSSWLDLIIALSAANREKLSGKLPSLKSLDRHGLKKFNKISHIQAKRKIATTKGEEDYEMYLALRSAENNLLVLIQSELEQNSSTEVVKQALDNFDAVQLAMQFRVHWKAALFRKRDLIDGLSKRERLTNLIISALSLRSCCKKDQGASKKHKKAKKSEHILAFKADQAIQLAACHDEDEKLESGNIAFSYYVVMETIVDYFQGKEQELDQSYRKKLTTFMSYWTSTDPSKPTTIVPRSEAKFYESFFGRIEVVGKDGDLHRIYFPIPWDCRLQMKNPLVKAERQSLLENVSRDNPEEKLDDFLDRGLQIQGVIEHQYEILTLSKFRWIIGFLTTYQDAWIAFAFALTMIINIVVLTYSESGNTGQFWLPSGVLASVEDLGYVHMLVSAILLLIYAIGPARVAINTGYKWRSMVEQKLIPISYGRSAEVAFETANALWPDSFWALFFVAADLMSIYYAIYLAFSCLGALYNPAFFAFHVIDIAFRSRVMSYVLKAVARNLVQVASTLCLGIIIVYIFTVISVNQWGWDSYVFGDGGTEWNRLGYAFMQNIDYGFRGPPVFNNDEDYQWDMFLFDFVYNILIILIMVAIITGIIIDTFADMRQSQNEIRDNTKNTCFICSLPREVFERHRIVFSKHLKRDHNMWNYIFYRMYLERKEDTELTGMEAYLKEQMTMQSISYFPVKQALALANLEKKDGELISLKTQVGELENKVGEIKANLTSDIQTMTQALTDKIENLTNKLLKAGEGDGV
mmetsp:Transcript_3905/g.5035  ORF Transcript_3905/g.5035 Transcript_3905/m.5035 type:complete len:915 (-) Transcript_3905:321-3065(-)